jgi:E3 ubiquitin-protein ligase MARCH6
MDSEKFERDASLFFKDEPIVVQHSGKESRPNAEEEEEEEEDEGDLPGLLADSDEDGEEDARELRGAARRGQRHAAWGPEWVDVGRVDVVDEEDVVAEADDDGEEPEGEEVDDAALAAQLADEDLAVEDDMEGALEGKEVSRYLEVWFLDELSLAIGMRGPLYVVAQNVWLRILKVMCVLKLCFSGSLDDLRARYGSRLRRLAPFHFRQVDRPALGESTPSLPRKPDLTSQQLDPRRALQVLHWPIRVIRVVTDPVVDSILLVISYLILPSIVRMLDGFFTAAFWALSVVVPGDILKKSARFVGTSVSLLFHLWHRFAERMAEGEYREFLMEYCKQLHRLRCFKVRC